MTNASSEPAHGVTLRVSASDAATEIFLVDARLARREKAVGAMEATVSPGLYKLRLRAGRTQVDRLIEVTPDKARKIDAAPVAFATAMPLDDTADADADHAQVVRDATTRRSERSGGSRLCLFVRNGADETGEAAVSTLSVHAPDGTSLAGLDDAKTGAAGLSALVFDRPAGFVRVRVSPPAAPVHEMFVPLPEGRQTEMFVFRDDEGGPRLRDASLRIARLGEAFDPSDPDLRLVELLRHALASGRDVLTETVLEQVDAARCAHPMLALYAAHLAIREGRIDTAQIVADQRGTDPAILAMPDMRALLLKTVRMGPPKGLRFCTPPMLRASWTLIAAASRRRMGLVPYASLAARVGEGLVADPLWLLGGRPDAAPGSSSDAMSFAAARRFLGDLAAREGTIRATPGATPLARGLLDIVRAEGGTPETLDAALHGIDAPRYSIARAARHLQETLAP